MSKKTTPKFLKPKPKATKPTPKAKPVREPLPPEVFEAEMRTIAATTR